MTHGGIRWHVSVHDWPLILIPVSIRSSDVAFHVPSFLFLSLSPIPAPHPPTPTASAYPSASATVRLMPRSPTTIILGDLRSRSISLTAATNYYPPLNPRHRQPRAPRRAAPRRRPGEAGKKNHAAERDTIGAFGGCRVSDATRG